MSFFCFSFYSIVIFFFFFFFFFFQHTYNFSVLVNSVLVFIVSACVHMYICMYMTFTFAHYESNIP